MISGYLENEVTIIFLSLTMRQLIKGQYSFFTNFIVLLQSEITGRKTCLLD